MSKNVLNPLHLNYEWKSNKRIRVRYRGTNMVWVNLPKPTDEGMLPYDKLNWNVLRYEYQIGGGE
jgi:hypothetical protein